MLLFAIELKHEVLEDVAVLQIGVHENEGLDFTLLEYI